MDGGKRDEDSTRARESGEEVESATNEQKSTTQTHFIMMFQFRFMTELHER